MNTEKKREFIINIIYLIIIFAIMYLGIKYALKWFLPFVIGFSIAFSLKPIIDYISAKLKINRRFVSVIAVLIFYITVGGLLTLVLANIFVELKELFSNLPIVYRYNIEPVIFEISNNIEDILFELDPNVVVVITDMVSSLAESIGSVISSISSKVVSFVSSALTMVPSFFIIILFTIISSFFFAIDYYRITGFITRQLSPKASNILFEAKSYIVGTLFKFIKAYSIIITITFIELSVGLSILKIENSVIIALLIACVDVLPVLGTGGIVIPWIFIELFKGDIPLAIGLLILYIVITVVRNIIEPKIVGEQVGLHPIIMLICIFIGVRLFGFLGLFILPITFIILKKLNDSGKINIFK